MIFYFLFSCTNVETEETDNTTEDVEEIEAQFAIIWQADGIDIDISYGDAGVWWFGIAETEGEIPWTGEDCAEGGTLENGNSIRWCHPLSLQGGFLQFGGDPSSLQIGEETAMTTLSNQNGPMYYFLNVIQNTCYIGGPGAELYGNLCNNVVQIAVEEPSQ